MFRCRAWPWAALPLAAVLAVDPSGLAPFGPIKWALVPTLVLLGVALRPPAWRGDWKLPAFVAWIVVTALFGVDGLYAWTGTPERHFGVLTWVLVLLAFAGGRALDGRARRLVLGSATVATGAMGAWATAEAFGWKPLDLIGIGDRPVGPFGTSAFLGAAAALLTPVAMGFALQSRGRARYAASAASALGLVALAASGARAAWFGAVVAAVVAVVVVRQRRVALLVAACAVAAIVVALASGVGGRASSVVSDENGGAHGRLDEWRIAVKVVAAHPVLGTGPEGYRLAFGKSVDDRYEQDHGRKQLPDRAHSAVLDIAATTGLPGLALYALAVGTALLAAIRTLRDGSPLMAGAAVGVIAYFAQSLFLFPIAELEPLAWLLAGLLATRQATTCDVPLWSLRRNITSCVVLGLAAFALVVGVADVASDRRAKRQLDAVTGDSAARFDVTGLRPDQIRYWLVRAQADTAPGATAGIVRAIDDMDRALKASPRDPVARTEKGRLLLTLAQRSNAPAGSVGRARLYLEQLANDDPRNAEVLLRLGVARELDHDDQGAIAAWERAAQLAPKSRSATTNLQRIREKLGTAQP